MKINFKGYVSKQEILENLAKTLNTLEDAGVNNYTGVEVYLSPQKNDQEAPVILDGEISESPTETFLAVIIRPNTCSNTLKITSLVTQKNKSK